jgi:hypothetical protein
LYPRSLGRQFMKLLGAEPMMSKIYFSAGGSCY